MPAAVHISGAKRYMNIGRILEASGRSYRIFQFVLKLHRSYTWLWEIETYIDTSGRFGRVNKAQVNFWVDGQSMRQYFTQTLPVVDSELGCVASLYLWSTIDFHSNFHRLPQNGESYERKFLYICGNSGGPGWI